jgi:outer membrane lipoprotein-sorting protein
MKRLFIAFLLILSTPLAAADALARLKSFIGGTHSAQANFTQEVRDKKGKHIQSASGMMQFSRPGKFRWSYQKPYEQIIVGDGTRFWLYDVELNQVTVKKLDAALGSSPAALLSGSHEIERDFDLKNGACEPQPGAGQQPASGVQGNSAPCAKGEDGLEWLEARPKVRDSGFERIRMAFNARSELVIMELYDAMGHVTVLHFYGMLINPEFPPALFKFEPPKGADVLDGE